MFVRARLNSCRSLRCAAIRSCTESTLCNTDCCTWYMCSLSDVLAACSRLPVTVTCSSISTRLTVIPKFHYIYLAQNLLKTRSPTCFEQKKSRGPGRRQVGDKFSTKKVGDLVSDLSATWSPTSRRPGLRQDRSNGIWALSRMILPHKNATITNERSSYNLSNNTNLAVQ